MRISTFRRGAVVLAALAIIMTGGMACFGDDDSSTDTELERIRGMVVNSVVELEVMRVRLTQLEESNQALADRVAGLQDENRELTHRIAELETAGPAANSAPVTAAMPDQSTASDEDRQLVRDFAECTLKMAGEVPESMIGTVADQMARQMWQEIEDGTTTIVQVRMGYAMLCGQ